MAKRRANGEGSVSVRKDGTFEVKVSYYDSSTGEAKRKTFYGKTRKEAVDKMKAFEEEIKKGILPTKEKLTVSQWLDRWAETYAKNRVRQNTFEGYKIAINAHLKPTIGAFILKELRPDQVQKMLNERLASGNQRTGGPLGARMVEYIYTVLHMALEQAVKNSLVARNVCDAVDKPKKRKHEFMPWTTEQMNQFLSTTQATRMFPVYMLVWGTGLRRSELLGLRWQDVDLKKGTITVNQTMVRVKGGYTFGEPKTKKSRRTIPLPGAVTSTMKAWKTAQNKEKLAFDGEYNGLGLVFCNEIGQPYPPEQIGRTFKQDLEKAKLPGIRFHDLRHGHATMLLELGEDLKVISDRLGHSTITLTADTYSHVREKMQSAASLKLDQTLKISELS